MKSPPQCVDSAYLINKKILNTTPVINTNCDKRNKSPAESESSGVSSGYGESCSPPLNTNINDVGREERTLIELMNNLSIACQIQQQNLKQNLNQNYNYQVNHYPNDIQPNYEQSYIRNTVASNLNPYVQKFCTTNPPNEMPNILHQTQNPYPSKNGLTIQDYHNYQIKQQYIENLSNDFTTSSDMFIRHNSPDFRTIFSSNSADPSQQTVRAA